MAAEEDAEENQLNVEVSMPICRVRAGTAMLLNQVPSLPGNLAGVH